jgi:hypothetical protein
MLIWKAYTPASTGMPPEKPGFSWDAWYQKNKARLSEKRAKRYREDASYRAAALERSRLQREANRTEVTTPHTVSFMDAATEIGVTVWVLREWRRKNYFPEPLRRDGRLWFTPTQVDLLRGLREFFDTHGTRVTNALRPKLEDTTSLIYSNW